MSLQHQRSASSLASSSSWVDAAMEVGGLIRTGAVEYWRSLAIASIFPLIGSLLYHYSRTVISINEGEQALWLQTWLMSQHRAIKQVRRIRLSSIGRVTHSHDDNLKQDEVDEKEGDEGRFAPPKLEFQPALGVTVLAWIGWWPVSVTCGEDREVYDNYGRRSVSSYGGSCIITIWFAPFAKQLTKEILLQGRQMWLEKRSKKTEIWTFKRDHYPQTFDVKTRPSRPLSSVIVEGNIKEMICEDAIRFLNSEQWYISKGIPYRRGYLLYGPPGCGKTSLVTALAGELRLPIILVPLHSDRMDDSQLAEIMGNTPKDCIIFMEDIDSALPRGTEKNANMMARMRGGAVTLSGLLNAIDGVGAQEGRLLFMSTNHRERLDEALIRPGRVDFQAYMGKASKDGASDLFDQFFVGIGATKELFTSAKNDFLDKLQPGAHSFASLQGVFMKARDDLSKVTHEMDKMLESASLEEDPKKETAWEAVTTLERETMTAQENEANNEQTQDHVTGYVVKRWTGSPTDVSHELNNQEICFQQFFITYVVPKLLAKSGTIYFELTFQETLPGLISLQCGFVKEGAMEGSALDSPKNNDITDYGCGDFIGSWAVDGTRSIKFDNGDAKSWNCVWMPGTVIGLAANVDTGMIAVSVDGQWEDGSNDVGVVFNDESIKEGVYPSFSAGRCQLKYCFDEDKMVHSPPPMSLWEGEKIET
ncbi:AAA+ family ATPase [Nitzschia inconspicua]|uniref:AAA+ family ATPase n=1 Tax=Nitzschia inconspicua TaxID=303405 RepID=A0A9K3Q4D4_9STRA|nr:AAA+ family ATPase [Nitzschia inconspicua]